MRERVGKLLLIIGHNAEIIQQIQFAAHIAGLLNQPQRLTQQFRRQAVIAAVPMQYTPLRQRIVLSAYRLLRSRQA